jgi:serine/threonine protein phosphatase PrpC
MSQSAVTRELTMPGAFGAYDPSTLGNFRDRGNSRNVMMDYCDAALSPDNAHALLVLADGMGGYAGGDLASELVVKRVLASFTEEGYDEPTGLLMKAFKQSADEIVTAREQNPDKQQMGTTLVVVVAGKGLIRVAHLGDSRAILFRSGYVFRLTKDHLAIVEREGVSDAGVKSDPKYKGRSNVLSRYIGAPGMSPDYFECPSQPGDHIVLVSDGVTEYVLEDRMHEILTQSPPQEAAQKIVEEAVANRSHDHCSCVVLRVA